jgi:hypothetical protein
MSNIIEFTGPNRATRKAMTTEALCEAELGFTDEELADLREALNQSNRAHLIENVRKQCLAVRVLLNELLDSYHNT